MKMNWKRFEVFTEFLIFGLLVGIVEDLIAIWFVTREPITWNVFGIVFLVAIPFAFIGEILIDRIDFVKIWSRIFDSKNKKKL